MNYFPLIPKVNSLNLLMRRYVFILIDTSEKLKNIYVQKTTKNYKKSNAIILRNTTSFKKSHNHYIYSYIYVIFWCHECLTINHTLKLKKKNKKYALLIYIRYIKISFIKKLCFLCMLLETWFTDGNKSCALLNFQY